MQQFLFLQPDGHAAPGLEALAARLRSIPGMALEETACTGFRLGRWRDAATGASCTVDLGDPGIEEDALHPPRRYAGWSTLPLSVHIPLAGPHWFCVEALRVVEAVLASDPGWRAIDDENVAIDELNAAVPAPWDRLGALASWERLRETQDLTRLPVPRMHRGASISCWRYCRERARGAALHPAYRWPERIQALQVGALEACSACLWVEPGEPLALPPVQLVVLPGADPRVVSSEALAAALQSHGLIGTAGTAGARLVAGGAAGVVAELAGTPASDFRPLDNESWRD
jgi:hypothetical protein